MSNYLFSGYEFNSELKADFKLQNLLQSQAGEDQQMSLKLLNRQSEGFAIGAKTPHGQTPQFVLDQIIGGITQNIITLDSSTSILALNCNVDLGNSYKIQNSIAPTDDRDLANKLYVDNLARVISIGLSTNTSGLGITGSPIIDSGDINIDLSSLLQNFSELSGDGLVQKTGVDSFTTFAPSLTDGQVLTTNAGTFAWEDLERVTSIGLTTASTGLFITNTPITDSGNINVDLSSRLENISNLSSLGVVFKDGIDTFTTTPIGSVGQFLGVNGSGQPEWQSAGTVTSVAMTTSSGLSVTGSPITSSGTLGLILNTPLQNFANIATDGLILKTGSSYLTSAVPAQNGMLLSSTNSGTAITWVPPESGGNVSGPSDSLNNSLAVWSGTTGRSLGSASSATFHNGLLTTPTISVELLANNNASSIRVVTPMYIDDLGGYSVTASYGYLNSNGSTGTGSGSNSYSIRCNNRVLASEFNANSSITLKNILARDSEIEDEALEIFKQISYTKYNYKDVIKEGDGEYFGVIAEELREVAPHFVNNNKMFIPNIYSNGEMEKVGENYTISVEGVLPEIAGDKVKVHTVDKALELDIISHNDSRMLVKSVEDLHQCEQLPSKVFVYGTYEDSPTVAKNKMFELGCVVLKNALHRIEQLENKVNNLC